MKSISIRELLAVVGGQVVGPHGVDGEIRWVCTDTRAMKPDSLYVALRGETHDGHGFVAQAVNGGATAVLVEQAPAELPAACVIRVPDTRRAMGRMASFVRGTLAGKVIAVGGSNGKTGTKHLIDSALRTRLRGTISPKSFNNDIGVPLAIFAADPQHDYTVLEMGTNHHGELRVLTTMASPDFAVITNCSAEHLEGLGSIEGVIREEASLIEGLRPEGALVVNGDDPRVLEAVRSYKGRRITFGLNAGNDLVATEIRCDGEGIRFRLKGQREFQLPLLGRHNACNALAAIAIGRLLGLEDDAIATGLAEASGPDMRLQLQRVGGVTILNDAYNANPASMKAALETLAGMPGGRRIAVLGDMRELGEATDALHREMGQFAATCPIDRLICVGEKAALIAEEALKSGLCGQRVLHFKDTAAAAAAVPRQVRAGDLVLLKASRTMKMELVAKAIAG